VTEPFYSAGAIASSSWAAFERIVARLLLVRGFSYSSVVGRSGDGGADVLGLLNGRRWLFQVKRWSSPVGLEVVAETTGAAARYGASIPVIVSKSGFVADVYRQQAALAHQGVKLQLWDPSTLRELGEQAGEQPLVVQQPLRFALRPYQESAVQRIVHAHYEDPSGSALIVLATGLGKTFVAAEALRRLRSRVGRVLVLAHTIDLVVQLERAFWPFLSPRESTCVVTSSDRPPTWSALNLFDYVFATRDSIASAIAAGVDLPDFGAVVVDECHHLGAATYESVLDHFNAGSVGGAFLLGMTATPWRPNGEGLDHRFTEPLIQVDLVRGLQEGHLANVDYRLFTDNVDWDRLRELKGDRFTPRAINRTMFIDEWDDGVAERVREAWHELGGQPRGIVFCGTVDHADRMASRINALGFTSAAAIYSKGSDGRTMPPVERNRLLWDFADGRVGVLCAVDVLNEGVDVPDVNLVAFQRVTHSRRIFVQQLGRGLRLAPGKDRVIVLDFVSDVRRFAAGLELKRALDNDGPRPGQPKRVELRSQVVFRRANSEDQDGATFLREWLKDLDAIEAAGEDASVLSYPDDRLIPHSKRSSK